MLLSHPFRLALLQAAERLSDWSGSRGARTLACRVETLLDTLFLSGSYRVPQTAIVISREALTTASLSYISPGLHPGAIEAQPRISKHKFKTLSMSVRFRLPDFIKSMIRNAAFSDRELFGSRYEGSSHLQSWWAASLGCGVTAGTWVAAYSGNLSAVLVVRMVANCALVSSGVWLGTRLLQRGSTYGTAAWTGLRKRY